MQTKVNTFIKVIQRMMGEEGDSSLFINRGRSNFLLFLNLYFIPAYLQNNNRINEKLVIMIMIIILHSTQEGSRCSFTARSIILSLHNGLIENRNI